MASPFEGWTTNRSHHPKLNGIFSNAKKAEWDEWDCDGCNAGLAAAIPSWKPTFKMPLDKLWARGVTGGRTHRCRHSHLGYRRANRHGSRRTSWGWWLGLLGFVPMEQTTTSTTSATSNQQTPKDQTGDPKSLHSLHDLTPLLSS